MQEVLATAVDPARVDALLQFILAVAACEDEPRDRELGPIHLLKYAFLADLAHAERYAGQTYTGVPWRFHHFGPWSAEVFERIEPALLAIGAEAKHISSRYADDFTRYRLGRSDAERVRTASEGVLPLTTQSRVAFAVHEFGSDTASLLRAVYLSQPMVNAAPEEILDFAAAVRETSPQRGPAEQGSSSRTRRERRRRVEEIRAEVQKRLAVRAAVGAALEPAPRYDEVFAEGVEWLDRLAGDTVPSITGDLTIADDIWKSRTRRDPDVP